MRLLEYLDEPTIHQTSDVFYRVNPGISLVTAYVVLASSPPFAAILFVKFVCGDHGQMSALRRHNIRRRHGHLMNMALFSRAAFARAGRRDAFKAIRAAADAGPRKSAPFAATAQMPA